MGGYGLCVSVQCFYGSETVIISHPAVKPALPAWMQNRHCEERSDVAISENNDEIASSKLTVFPRNDKKITK
ncbi:hypothetical protein A3306_01705 [Rickettsia bellii]|uniref:Putative 30S ribosomal protein S16 n=2 Tax=Rickettsia bellii TaxID=33990 RepID=A0A0F3QK96_RICBE|nr:hypothetical protein [Rickettsia bellii]ABV79828.1 30S ribosomal protein S16 [Rickettsia bellii OSU 85-389]ARD85979.1 hypothetical protein A3306_01705 [Rickettsia bellii]KJV90570.1 putative 30S ribosomal protein S16 [Rickettsia bellii str. RML An4]KJV92551.1 putative 30S ribosomal protein S16 [Rickettsia bellii str. RML Mogi]